MHIECPHCQNPIEVVESAALKEIVCPSCGSSFSTSDLPTKSYHGPTPPFAKLGRFELKEQLGQGAFGSVWRAHDSELDRDVAVKIPRPGVMGGQEFEDRFLRELRTMAGLRHEGIVTVHEGGRQDGSLYIVSDLIRGLNLAEWLTGQPGGRLGMREAATLLAQIADAVEHAHTQGVIHRDLKPSNILLDESGRPHITDFGLAKREAVEVPITREGRHLGTPAYMSPEQARGQSHRADARSDVWSLGVILYELLTGERPFRGVERMILHQILKDEPRSLRQINDHIPLDLDTIALKCLQKEPDRRYPSAGHLAADLRRWLGGEPILARPVGPAERLWRWAKRNPRVAALSAAVLLLLVTIAIGSTAAMLVISKKERAAILAAKVAEESARRERHANTQLAQANTDLENANASERAAKQDTDQKRIDAETARDETKQVLDYLVASFRKPDPDADGEKLTVVQLFEQAAVQLGTTFPNKPLIQAELLNAIGGTYLGLGLYQKAIAVFERARDLRRNELGEDHEGTFESMNNLALAYRFAGRLAEALPLFEQTLELMKTKLGAEHPDTLTTMNNLALAYNSAGRLGEALQLYEQTLDLRRAKLGPEHPDTLTSMNNLAAAYESAGRPVEALPLKEQTLGLRKAKLGPEHPDTLTSMNNLAGAYESAGRIAEALPLYEQTLDLRKAKLGSEHPDTLISMNNLAYAYNSAGRLAAALPLYEEALELKKAKLGPEHPSTLLSMNNLAKAYTSAGRLAEALPLYEQTLELMKANLGPDHPDTLGSMGNLANAYLMDEQPEKALDLFDRFIAARRGRATPDDSSFAILLAAVALDLLQHRQHSAAETYLRECLTIRETKLPDDWVLFNTKSLLGGALAGQKKFQEAEPLLVEGYSGMKRREANIPPAAQIRLPEAIRRLVDLYTAWDRPDEAEKWRKKLDSMNGQDQPKD